MIFCHIFTASVFGSTLDIADYVANLVEPLGYTPVVYNDADISKVCFQSDDLLLFLIATTGNGDFPDGFQPAMFDISNDRVSFANNQVGVVAFGDSSYPRFCGAGTKLYEVLQKKQNINMFPLLTIDDSSFDEPEVKIKVWIGNNF